MYFFSFPKPWSKPWPNICSKTCPKISPKIRPRSWPKTVQKNPTLQINQSDATQEIWDNVWSIRSNFDSRGDCLWNIMFFVYAYMLIVVAFFIVRIVSVLAVFRNPVVWFGRTLMKMNASILSHLSKQSRTLSCEQQFEHETEFKISKRNHKVNDY